MIQRRDTGRPEFVYGRRCKQRELEHECRVAMLEWLLKARIDRDATVRSTDGDGTVHEWAADGRAVIDGIDYRIECDNSGKTTRKQWERAWKAYRGFEGFILIVTLTKDRMDRIRSWAAADPVKDKVLCNTFFGIQKKSPWLDPEGVETQL